MLQKPEEKSKINGYENTEHSFAEEELTVSTFLIDSQKRTKSFTTGYKKNFILQEKDFILQNKTTQ